MYLPLKHVSNDLYYQQGVQFWLVLYLVFVVHTTTHPQYKTTEDPGLSIAADRVNRPVAGRGPEGYDVLQDEDLLLP